MYNFIYQAILAAPLSSFSLALFSPLVTLRPVSYMGEALSHIAFAGIALAVAARSSSIMGYHGMIFLFNLPLLFASNALYPLANLPGWIRIIALANPTTYLIDALRALVFGSQAMIAVPVSWAVLIIFAILGMVLALRSFQEAVRSR